MLCPPFTPREWLMLTTEEAETPTSLTQLEDFALCTDLLSSKALSTIIWEYMKRLRAMWDPELPPRVKEVMCSLAVKAILTISSPENLTSSGITRKTWISDWVCPRDCSKLTAASSCATVALTTSLFFRINKCRERELISTAISSMSSEHQH